MPRSVEALQTKIAVVLVSVLPLCGCGGQRRDETVSPESGARRVADIPLSAEIISSFASVARGATLETMLRAAGIASGDVQRAIIAARALFDVRGVRTTHAYHVDRKADGSL